MFVNDVVCHRNAHVPSSRRAQLWVLFKGMNIDWRSCCPLQLLIDIHLCYLSHSFPYYIHSQVYLDPCQIIGSWVLVPAMLFCGYWACLGWKKKKKFHNSSNNWAIQHQHTCIYTCAHQSPAIIIQLSSGIKNKQINWINVADSGSDSWSLSF